MLSLGLVRFLQRGLLATAFSCKLFGGEDTPDVRPCWVSRHTGWSFTRPGVSGNLVFVADGTGRVRALDQKTGTERWSTLADPTGRMIGWNFVIAQGTLVAPAAFQAIGIEAATGVVKWRYEPPIDTLEPYNRPSKPGYLGGTRLDVDGSVVFIPAWGASISAVDVNTGQAIWIWRPPATTQFRSGSNGVKAHGDTVYATAWHHVDPLGARSEIWLLALDRRDGHELWRKVFPPYTSGLSVEGTPAVFGDLVIFTSAGGFEYAVNRFTKELVWQFTPQTEQATGSQTELRDGVVYHDGGDGHVYSLDAATGSMRWKAPFDGGSSKDILVTDRRIYIPSGGIPVTVLDRASGSRVASLKDPTRISDLNGAFTSGGTFADGRVFFGASSGAACFREP